MMASSARYWTGARLTDNDPFDGYVWAPRGNPIFAAEITAFTFSLFLGLTNGILGSVPMIQAPTKVEDRYRELCGKFLTSRLFTRIIRTNEMF
ncbi:hypothetical protein NQ317_011681 [Molorchus minor]|uniref:Uncharacterized protein n=1 Tax=Molorchus minor TaxID=1323400 RepID=A0ABQ9IS99_9CUCU|nr:hypothetical protein NQ317_011681 [Molorchus minor]